MIYRGFYSKQNGFKLSLMEGHEFKFAPVATGFNPLWVFFTFLCSISTPMVIKNNCNSKLHSSPPNIAYEQALLL